MAFISVLTAESTFFFADERVLFHLEAEPKKVYYVRGAVRAFAIPGFPPYMVWGFSKKIFFARAGTLIWPPCMGKRGGSKKPRPSIGMRLKAAP